MKTAAVSLLTIILLSFSGAQAEELEMINRPVNTNGLTGLLFTTAPYTLAPGTIETGFTIMSEDSAVPSYTSTEYRASVSAGLGHNMEFSLIESYFHKKTNITTNAKERGSGDAELSLKWNFRPQSEDSLMPALALLISAVFPTGDKDQQFNQVNNWGARIGLSAGSEISWEDHVIGVYADAQAAVRDLSNSLYRDRYGLMNAGILLPISKQRNLQLFIEYSFIGGKNVTGVYGLDYSAMSYGLRMVSERVNLSMGTQFMQKQIDGYDNSGKVIGTLSIKY